MTTEVEFAPGYARDEERSHIILLPRDVEWRRELYVPEVFHHPAKMQLHIVKLCVEYLESKGELIPWMSRVLDPFGGTGTSALAALMGYETTLIELEEEWFLPILQGVRKKWRNWTGETGSPRPFMENNFHWAAEHLSILIGDSRQVMRELPENHYDLIITSPPYANLAVGRDFGNQVGSLAEHKEELRKYGSDKASTLNFGRLNTFQFNQNMKVVYQQVGRVLKPGGYYVSVTKDQMRAGERQRLGPEVMRYAQEHGNLTMTDWFKWKPPGGMLQSVMREKGSVVVEDEDIIFMQKGVS